MREIEHIQFIDNSQVWKLDGKFHRLDGPAVIDSDGRHAWYVNGIHVSNEVRAWMKTNNITLPFTEEEQAQFILTFT